MLELQPITLAEANAFVSLHHRHHRPVVGHLFSVAVNDGKEVVGVAIIGRPVARLLQDGYTAEVLRCCTDGTKNAPSMLYRAAWRAARALGYRKLITYTLPEEGGASLRAAAFRCVGTAGGGTWNRKDRPRVDKHPTQGKIRWEINLETDCHPGRDHDIPAADHPDGYRVQIDATVAAEPARGDGPIPK